MGVVFQPYVTHIIGATLLVPLLFVTILNPPFCAAVSKLLNDLYYPAIAAMQKCRWEP